jgi:hypothetical protein
VPNEGVAVAGAVTGAVLSALDYICPSIPNFGLIGKLFGFFQPDPDSIII